MRLRYVKITGLPPLEDVEIQFQHETLLGRECSIRFVVGVNGSGKSRLLRALTEVFVQLEGSTRLKLPFSITLAYDIHRSGSSPSVYLHYPGKSEDSRFVVFNHTLPDNTNWTDFDADNLPDDPLYSVDLLYKDGELPGTIEAYIPQALIAYTSGNPASWQAIFALPLQDADISLDDVMEEYPPRWTAKDELAKQKNEFIEQIKELVKQNNLNPELVRSIIPVENLEPDFALLQPSRIAYLVTTDNLKLAMLSVSLLEAIDDLENNPLPEEKKAFVQRIKDTKLNNQTMRGLRGLLNEVDWLWPITVGLEIDFDTKSLALRRNRTQVRQLYQAATSVIKRPEPSTARLLLFDLQRPAPQDENVTVNGNPLTINKLAEAIAGNESYTAFDIYRNLHQLHQQGILKAVQIAVQKTNLKDVLMYDWLSDGEQEFLGRMALFHLLKDQDDALVILDEPETHFNDVWKRRIVDIIDDSLRDNVSEVVISTHSSIALTDVFETEITLLRKDTIDGTIAVIRQPAINTFGASPNEIMRHIFNAPDTVGQRATEFLDMLLMAIAQPDDVEAIWHMSENEDIESSQSFTNLMEYISKLPHDYGDDSEKKSRLLALLSTIHNFTKHTTQKTEVGVVDAIDALRSRIGPGYYEFELNRRLRALQRK